MWVHFVPTVEQVLISSIAAKGRVSDWLTAQPSDTIENGLTWNVVCTTPYMDMLHSVSLISSRYFASALTA